MDEFQQLLAQYAETLGYRHHELAVHIDAEVEEDRAVANVTVLYRGNVLLTETATAASAVRAVESALLILGCDLAAQMVVWESAGEFLDARKT